ncbi:MAG: bifunctional metallophosphatase/5'-nucleotidase [Ignavibacteria bacterium]|nr:bifunctional metallophosphatase/5'-nucleotidase [Ignavibacteria bacterium]
MKKFPKFFRILSIFLLISGYLFSSQENITILFVNDSHSHLAPSAPRDENLNGKVGGFARLASLVFQVRSEENNVLLLHSGDYSIGDLFYNTTFGVFELKALQNIGLDALTLGNHDFDLTPYLLLSAFDSAFTSGSFPILCANAVYTNSSVDDLKKYIKPYTIKNFGAIKVGIFGLTTPSTNLLSNPSPIFIDTNIFEIASRFVDTLYSKGCQIVICLSHLGVNLDKLLAYNIPGIDIIISGHDHLPISQPIEITNSAGKKTYIVQTKGYYSQVGKVTFSFNKETGQKGIVRYQLIDLDENIPESSVIKAEINSVIADIEKTYCKVYSQLVGYALSNFDELTDIKSSGPYDTDVGNLVTDAFRAKTGTDIAIIANGLTAKPLPAGPITPIDLFRTIGYGFNTVNGLGYRIATFEITGLNLMKSLELALASLDPTSDYAEDEFLIQVSGMKYVVDFSKAPGNRIVSVTVGNQPLDMNKTYTVTANEFLLLFLDFLGVSISNPKIFNETAEFQVLLEYVTSKQQISPQPKGRIISPNQSSVETQQQGELLPIDLYFDYYNQKMILKIKSKIDSLISIEFSDILGKQIYSTILQISSPNTYELSFPTTCFGPIFSKIRTSFFQMQKPIAVF